MAGDSLTKADDCLFGADDFLRSKGAVRCRCVVAADANFVMNSDAWNLNRRDVVQWDAARCLMFPMVAAHCFRCRMDAVHRGAVMRRRLWMGVMSWGEAHRMARKALSKSVSLQDAVWLLQFLLHQRVCSLLVPAWACLGLSWELIRLPYHPRFHTSVHSPPDARKTLVLW